MTILIGCKAVCNNKNGKSLGCYSAAQGNKKYRFGKIMGDYFAKSTSFCHDLAK